MEPTDSAWRPLHIPLGFALAVALIVSRAPHATGPGTVAVFVLTAVILLAVPLALPLAGVAMVAVGRKSVPPAAQPPAMAAHSLTAATELGRVRPSQQPPRPPVSGTGSASSAGSTGSASSASSASTHSTITAPDTDPGDPAVEQPRAPMVEPAPTPGPMSVAMFSNM